MEFGTVIWKTPVLTLFKPPTSEPACKAIALQAGCEVGGLKRVNTGVFQITVPNSTKVSSWGSYDTTTIKKDITAVMGVTFAVKK